ncbi:MAG: hypothetical protein LBB58_06650, partial [Cellulomonadaceae bacterium]|nr:hypothetical protein [Cellulomonadaceae bacterium]
LCQTRYTWWLGAYWGIGSPLALARNERVQAATTPYIQQCLSENGIAFPSEATFEELELLAWNMLAVPTFQAIHCQFDFDGEIVTLRPWLPIPDDHRAEWLRWVEEGGVFSLGS